MESIAELRLREQLMAALGALRDRNGGFVTRDQLSDFPLGGDSYRLIDQSRGIWNPRWASCTLSILSSPDGPYADEEAHDGVLRYAYRSGGSDGDNRKLREAMRLGVPVILLRKIATGVYVPVFPVYVVADDPDAGFFHVALDESVKLLADSGPLTDDQRRYAERVAKVRLHQPEFRGRVIRAYETRCAVCSLRHGELLDAAHIVPDGEVLGQPVVQNGLSLCKIHHAAYDANFLGVDPDATVHINRDLLAERDGPMLRHGLQEMNGRTLLLPRHRTQRPDRERLALRFEEFQRAS